jgi:NAD(P)H-flavin reductase
VEDLAAVGNHRPVTLILGAVTSNALYDVEHLNNLAAVLPWLKVVPAVERGPLRGARRGSAVDVALDSGHWARAEIYLCGPAAMVAASRQRLLGAGCPPQRVHSEDYTQHVHPPLSEPAYGR